MTDCDKAREGGRERLVTRLVTQTSRRGDLSIFRYLSQRRRTPAAHTHARHAHTHTRTHTHTLERTHTHTQIDTHERCGLKNPCGTGFSWFADRPNSVAD